MGNAVRFVFESALLLLVRLHECTLYLCKQTTLQNKGDCREHLRLVPSVACTEERLRSLCPRHFVSMALEKKVEYYRYPRTDDQIAEVVVTVTYFLCAVACCRICPWSYDTLFNLTTTFQSVIFLS